MAIRGETGAGAFFVDAEDMVVFLQSKFNEKRDAVYQVKEIDVTQPEEVQAATKLKFYHMLGVHLIRSYSFLSKNNNSQSS